MRAIDVFDQGAAAYPKRICFRWGEHQLAYAEVQRLSHQMHAALKSDPAYFERTGSEPHPLSPEDFAKFQRAEIDRWARIVTAAGIEPE